MQEGDVIIPHLERRSLRIGAATRIVLTIAARRSLVQQLQMIAILQVFVHQEYAPRRHVELMDLRAIVFSMEYV